MCFRGTHFLMTRFNVRGGHDWAPPPDRWMERRIQLFEDWCLPSIERQTCRAFRWLVFFDASTSQRWRKHISAWSAVEPVWLNEPFTAGAAARTLDATEGPVLTTRLDNDDALSPTFVERLHAAAARPGVHVVSFPVGYQWASASGRFYLRIYPQNPFISRVEEGIRAESVYGLKHWDLSGEHITYRWGPPAWLQVIHGDQLANQLRGVRIHPRHGLRIFPHATAARESRRQRAKGQLRDVLDLSRSLADADFRKRARTLLRRNREA